MDLFIQHSAQSIVHLHRVSREHIKSLTLHTQCITIINALSNKICVATMKPKLLKKFGRTRMRKLSSSDCSTRKSSLDISEGPSAGFNDSSSSLRTVTAVESRPALVLEKAFPVEPSSLGRSQTTYTHVNDNASSILINQVHAAVHHLPAPAPPATQPPAHVHQYPPTMSHHSTRHYHQQKPQEFVYYPTYRAEDRATSFIREHPQVDEMPSPSITASSAAAVPPLAMAAPGEDASILQARREAIEATAKLLGANHPDTLLAIQSMQKHCNTCRNSASASNLYMTG